MVSLKDQVVKHTNNQYVLPHHGTMKVDVHAFLSDELFKSSEDTVWEQIYISASYEGVIGAYLMPDCHQGYSIPIGSVVVTEDTLIQSGNGFDVSCGILHMKVNGLKANGIKSIQKRRDLITQAEKRIATGMGMHRPELMPQYSEREAESILRYGAQAIGVNASVCERQFIPLPDDFNSHLIEKAYDKVIPQLGSIGGSNHFWELQCDPETGDVWVMIHCGSRGYGYQTADYFFYEGAKLRGLPINQREKSYLRIDEPLGKQYWNYCSSAANFAVANRHIIAQSTNEALENVFGIQGEVFYEISHNLVQQETLVLPDGTTKKGFVHRKGSTRAFPAGHPDLVGTKWESTGHPCLIPGSMKSGAAILFPLQGAYNSCCSVNHGSGRIMGRKEAERKLEHKQQRINDDMRNVLRTFNGVQVEGIVSNCRNIPLDESDEVYKDLDAVLNVLEEEGIAKISHRLMPIANMKGQDEGKRSKKNKKRDKAKDHRKNSD